MIMILKFIYRPLGLSSIDSRLCGEAVLGSTVIGSVLGAGINTFGSIWSSNKNTSSQKGENQKNRDWQTDENQKNRDWQTDENQKNRGFASSEAEKQRNWSTDEWQRQFEAQRKEWYNQLYAQYGAQWDQYVKEMEYNSPQNQVARMGQAGLNPSAVLGANLGGLSSAAHLSSAGSPAVPTGGTVSGAAAGSPSTGSPSAGSPSTGSVGLTENPFRMSDFGSLVRDLSEAIKTNKSLQPYLDNLLSDTQLKLAQAGLTESMKVTQEVTNFILEKTKDKKVQQATADYLLTLSEIAVNASQEGKFNSESLFIAQETYTEQLKGHLTEVQLADAKIRLSFATQRQQAELDNLVSSTAKNRADASLSASQKLSEDRFRELRATAIRIHYELETNQSATLTVKTAAEVENLLAELRHKNILNEKELQEVERLKNENGNFNLKELRLWLTTLIYGASMFTPSGGHIPVSGFTN